MDKAENFYNDAVADPVPVATAAPAAAPAPAPAAAPTPRPNFPRSMLGTVRFNGNTDSKLAQRLMAGMRAGGANVQTGPASTEGNWRPPNWPAAPANGNASPAPTTPVPASGGATPTPQPAPAPATPPPPASQFQFPSLPGAPRPAEMPKKPAKVCYGAGTQIRMADGSWKPIEEIRLLDEVLLGGVVIGIGQALTDQAFLYEGAVVTGSHAVFEAGRFVRVADSMRAMPIDLAAPIVVFPVVTENHLMVTRTHLTADFAETDRSTDQLPAERLAEMNADADRLQRLGWIERDGAAFGDGALPHAGALWPDLAVAQGTDREPVSLA